VVLPLIILFIAHLRSCGGVCRWKNIEDLQIREQEASDARPNAEPDHSPARIVAWSMVALGAGMACLMPINPGNRVIILIFALVLVAIGAAMFRATKMPTHKDKP
jgi:4-hydroxybenzoate polyprenyltransferase